MTIKWQQSRKKTAILVSSLAKFHGHKKGWQQSIKIENNIYYTNQCEEIARKIISYLYFHYKVESVSSTYLHGSYTFSGIRRNHHYPASIFILSSALPLSAAPPLNLYLTIGGMDGGPGEYFYHSSYLLSCHWQGKIY